MPKAINNITAETVRELFEYRGNELWWRKPSSPLARIDMTKPAGGIYDSKGYRQIGINGRNYQAHRLIWLHQHGDWPAHDIDHIDNNPGNNAIDNLRDATCSQNRCNIGAHRDNASGRKGVTWDKSRNKWKAHIQINGKQINLGRFADIEEAGAAYAEAAEKHHGDFARPT